MSLTYLIKGLSRAGTTVFTYSDAASANRAAEMRFPDAPTTVASEEADLLQKSGPALVALYNGLVAEGVPPVNKFTTRADGARRVFVLLIDKYSTQPIEDESSNVAPDDDKSAGEDTNEDDMAAKGKKVKKTPKPKKAPRVKKERVEGPKKVRVKKEQPAGPKKTRAYQDEVISKGSEKRKAEALAMIERKMGATADEIKDKLGLSLGTAKNLVWYLRREGKKIVVDKTSERRPYVMA